MHLLVNPSKYDKFHQSILMFSEVIKYIENKTEIQQALSRVFISIKFVY